MAPTKMALQPSQTHEIISPAILYWGTPIVLITTENEDGTSNICPMSSAWWLAHRCMIGLSARSKTTQNVLRTKQCVLNLPSEDMTDVINALARTTGSDPIPEWKANAGYVHVKDKFGHADITSQPSDLVRPPRIQECPVQMECEMMVAHEMMKNLPDRKGSTLAIELRILRTHIKKDLRMEAHRNRIDASQLRPMFMVFQEYYGMSKEKLVESRLAKIDEGQYRAITRSDVVSQGADGDVAKDKEDVIVTLGLSGARKGTPDRVD